ncbi:MAG: hypothetical protein WCP91_02220 [Candidatus Berkelbacteria bacterium]
MKKSLQKIEDFYYQKGLRADDLRQALTDDQDYQKLLAERKASLQVNFNIPAEDEGKFVLSTDNDYEILSTCYELEKKNLSTGDEELVGFIKSQLELDWRNNLTDKIQSLKHKYK